MCFNSLQTGKRIQSPNHCGLEKVLKKVSIPFKRESVSKVEIKFKIVETQAEVSIPFKRESVSKVKRAILLIVNEQGFNSLQTGKRIQSQSQKASFAKDSDHTFQFPSNGKAYPKFIFSKGFSCIYSLCFNSLQTGKRIQSDLKALREELSWAGFQFPSNGKAYPKRPHFNPSGAVAPYA